MKPTLGIRSVGLGAVALSLFVATAPASAQFARVVDVPATQLFSVSANGDTIAAGADAAVYLSTNAGATWQRSAAPVSGVTSIQAILMRNGRLYAGTFGQGVHISDDLGATWHPFNEGLVGGILDSQLDIADFALRGDNLYAATAGAGVYVRSLAGPGTWSLFGSALEPNQASNVNSLALGGSRVLAMAGSNGQVFYQDPGDVDWAISNLDNVGIHAGLQAYTATFTGTGWVVGTPFGVFRSLAGQEPWALSGLGLGPIDWAAFATQGQHLFAAFDIPTGAVFEDSDDDGATWQNPESLPGVFVKQMVLVGNDLYAARGDGLWRRSIATASVPIATAPGALGFALAGAQPFRDQARLRFDMPAAGTASIEVFDVLGRRAGDRIDGWWSSGPHEVSLDARRLGPGVYAARLMAAGTSEVVRLVHVR